MGKRKKNHKSNSKKRKNKAKIVSLEHDNNINPIGEDQSQLIALRDDSNVHSPNKIDWIAEIKKALLTSLFVVVISTLVRWMIYNASPGEFKNEKLYDYLTNIIAKDLGLRDDDKYVVVDRILDTKEDYLVFSGKYKNNDEEYYCGCFVYIFERAPRNFWNVLVGTEAGYEIELSSKSVGVINYDFALECEDCYYEDINGDDKDEALFLFRSNFADRVTYFFLIFQYYEGNWHMISSDFDNLKSRFVDLGESAPKLLMDCFDFTYTNSNETENLCIYGLSHGGCIKRVNNPIWGGYDWIYYIIANDGDTGLLDSDKVVITMERVTENGFFTESNWNGGKLIYTSINELENIDYNELWGIIRNGTMFFYGEDE